MDIETVGHAGLLLRSDRGAPLLFTDPWISGSCYWRSWWLQHYPDASLLDELRSVPFCYITHEHPDHFHTASIRLLGRDVRYLTPDFPNGHVVPYLTARGHKATAMPAFQWIRLHEGVEILSIPLLNDDSVLLVNTPHAIIVNANDSKPRPSQVRQLSLLLDTIAPGKRRVLLSSYSPASIVNSFLRNGQRVSLRQKASYARAISESCRLLRIDDFIPFASQVVFKRRDSAWANEFKVTYEDLQRDWSGAPTRLLPPYTRLDLETGDFSAVASTTYRHQDSLIVAKVEAQEALDATADFTDEDTERLRRKFAHCRWLLAMLCPRGIGFELEHTHLHYDPWTGRLLRGATTGDFVLRVPAQAFKDAVSFGHFGDLGTTMFTIVVLNSGIHPWRVYAFFMLITMHDYGHTASTRNWFGWLLRSLRIHRWRIPPTSTAVPVQA